MILERHFFEPRSGCLDDVVGYMKAEIERVQQEGYPLNARLLTPAFARFDQILLETRFDSLVDSEQFWTGWLASEASKAFSQKVDPLLTGEGRREVWGVFEPAPLAVTGKLVNWRVAKVVPGCQETVVGLLMGERGVWNRFEILTSIYGPVNQVALAFEFDKYEDYHQEWEDWVRERGTPEFWQQWHQAVKTGGDNEVWNLA